MKRPLSAWGVALIAAFGAARSVHGQYIFTQIDYPNGFDTECIGISNSGVITGDYTDAFGTIHGFTLTGSTFATADYPGSGFGIANGVNTSGQLVGRYGAYSNATKKAYTRIGSTYTDLATISGSPLGGALYASANSINDAGQIVGEYYKNNVDSGYLYDPNATPKFTTFLPSGPGISATAAAAFGINNSGDIVGFYGTSTGVEHAFLLSGGVYTTIDPVFPGQSILFPAARGITESGLIVGDYQSSFAVYHGFIKNGSTYTQLDYPLANDTRPFGINNAGQIVGFYEDAGGQIHGFLATPVAEADFNSDGYVDGDDLTAWQGGFGLATGATKSLGDANGDFAVDGADFLKWQTQVTIGAAASPGAAPIPEPAALALAVASMAGLASYRSTRRRAGA